MRTIALRIALLAGLMSAVAAVAADAAGPLPWERLERGEILVEPAPGPEGLPGVHAVFLVHAPRAAAWRALVDYPNFPRIYEGIEKMRVLDDSAQGATVEMWVNGPLGRFHYVIARRYERPGERVTWNWLSGDVPRLGGSWEIRDTGTDGVYLMDYRGYTAGLPVPEFVARPFVEQRTLAMAERLRAWIEGRRAASR